MADRLRFSGPVCFERPWRLSPEAKNGTLDEEKRLECWWEAPPAAGDGVVVVLKNGYGIRFLRDRNTMFRDRSRNEEIQDWKIRSGRKQFPH